MIAIKIDDTVAAALACISGAYGNGDERKEKLTADGYDPAKVQSCINDLLPIIERYK